MIFGIKTFPAILNSPNYFSRKAAATGRNCSQQQVTRYSRLRIQLRKIRRNNLNKNFPGHFLSPPYRLHRHTSNSHSSKKDCDRGGVEDDLYCSGKGLSPPFYRGRFLVCVCVCVYFIIIIGGCKEAEYCVSIAFLRNNTDSNILRATQCIQQKEIE